jgi:Predicted periplasmic solute-binding protein
MATKSANEQFRLRIVSLILKLLFNIAFYVFIAFVIINVSKLAYDFTYQLYGPVTAASAPGTDITVEIQKGDSTMDVATKLESELAVTNKYAFYLKSKLQEAKIMPGSYSINTSMTYDEILGVITELSNSKSKDGDNKDSGAGSQTSKQTANGTDTKKQ